MSDRVCTVCGDEYEMETDVCQFCRKKAAYAELAKRCGLTRYPHPAGERYVYFVDGKLAGKKGECIDFMDELWRAVERLSKGR